MRCLNCAGTILTAFASADLAHSFVRGGVTTEHGKFCSVACAEAYPVRLALSADLFPMIRPRSVVTIRTAHGSQVRGRAVMPAPAGWVLNLGGKHGTPGIATESNVLAVR